MTRTYECSFTVFIIIKTSGQKCQVVCIYESVVACKIWLVKCVCSSSPSHNIHHLFNICNRFQDRKWCMPSHISFPCTYIHPQWFFFQYIPWTQSTLVHSFTWVLIIEYLSYRFGIIIFSSFFWFTLLSGISHIYILLKWMQT